MSYGWIDEDWLARHDAALISATLACAAEAACEWCGKQEKFWHPANEHGDHLHIKGHQDAQSCRAVKIRAITPDTVAAYRTLVYGK